MQILSVILENIKSYRSARIALNAGTTAIRGYNGAGKSTIIAAVGAALFGYFQGSQNDLVREGETGGKIVVTFVSANDERVYDVERRLGRSAKWFVHDPEMRSRVAEDRDDVQDFLRLHLGIDSTMPLAELFSKAIAVPQGTFTADFLQTAGKRREIFEGLLQVADYTDAPDALREAVNECKSRLAALDVRLAEIQARTADLPSWRGERENLLTEVATLASRVTALAAERVTVEGRITAVRAALEELARLEQIRDRAHHAWQLAEEQTRRVTADETRAATAATACQNAEAGHRHFLATETDLRAAQADQACMQDLEKILARLEAAARAHEAARDNALQQLHDAEAAAGERDRLIPLVARQQDLEERLKAAQDAVKTHGRLIAEQKRMLSERATIETTVRTVTEQIAALERLQDLAALAPARREAHETLVKTHAAQAVHQKRFEDLRAQRDRLAKQVQAAEITRHAADAEVRHLRSLLPQAAEWAACEQRRQDLAAKISRTRAEITHTEQSLHASQGGECPFLREPCQNLARRGVHSLESYFTTQLTAQMAALLPVERDLAGAETESKRLATLRAETERLPEREHAATQIVATLAEMQSEWERARAACDAAQAELCDPAALQREIQAAKQALDASAKAERDVAQLALLDQQRSQQNTRLGDMTARLGERETEIQTAADLAAPLAGYQQALRELGDPRTRQAHAGALAAQIPAKHAAIAAKELEVAQAAEQIVATTTQLAPFADLAQRIAGLQAAIAATRDAHETYLRNESDAARLPEMRAHAETARAHLAAAATARDAATATCDAHAATADPAALVVAQERQREIDAEFAAVTERITGHGARVRDLEAKIAAAERELREGETAQRARDRVEEALGFIEYSRKIIKEAGPLVTRRLLREISATANRVFGEIMGDRSATLTWKEDFDISVRVGPHERHFSQLSGGEQMSAALAVRMALLRRLSRANLAIFDEPTQNMDEERRVNLAGQIRRVTGFDQLIVISHDDTFEEGLDAVIHVRKERGDSVAESLGGEDQPASLLPFPLHETEGGLWRASASV